MKLTRKKVLWGVAVLAAAAWYFFSLPSTLFKVPYSTILVDRENNLLNASISKDGQWRFPVREKLPAKFREAIVMFEDKRFFSHVGVDPRALYRATLQNIDKRKVVSGGSTLSMQVIRLARGNPKRTVFNKTIEMILATRLEIRFSKDEILSLYASHAPFGGNVVGIEAACWRYFGRQPDELSWAEAATLAVLPNNPSMINLGTNRAALQKKRDRLLTRLR
ncbi:MAG TPA: transglycosylase domain-containing protein, partial [Cyclobacteriaceae bacterium]|nr:transglycosylase domain-containing protein [Cyclobacteriaceae bacterium]